MDRVELSENEQRQLIMIRERLDKLRAFLTENASPPEGATPGEWYRSLAAMKEIVGNASNDLSFVACLLAKDYLCRRFAMRPFDAASKPQGAPGLDIDEETVAGERVIGEIKTTTPYKADDLGAAQKASFAKDFEKLRRTDAHYKFFFVTDHAAHDVVRRRYAAQLAGVEIVLLSGVDDHIG